MDDGFANDDDDDDDDGSNDDDGGDIACKRSANGGLRAVFQLWNALE
jgi:hypothetical protein